MINVTVKKLTSRMSFLNGFQNNFGHGFIAFFIIIPLSSYCQLWINLLWLHNNIFYFPLEENFHEFFMYRNAIWINISFCVHFFSIVGNFPLISPRLPACRRMNAIIMRWKIEKEEKGKKNYSMMLNVHAHAGNVRRMNECSDSLSDLNGQMKQQVNVWHFYYKHNMKTRVSNEMILQFIECLCCWMSSLHYMKVSSSYLIFRWKIGRCDWNWIEMYVR